MDEKLLKTSLRQRIIVAAIAILLLGTTIATYVAIVASSGSKGSTSKDDLEKEYSRKEIELTEYAGTLSEQYFGEFSSYRSEVKAYNAEAANATGVRKTDLKEGDGRELTTGDIDYYAYYIGWCADESVFDSSFDDYSNPTSLKVPIYAGQGMIEGWNEGVVGMKLGGVREIMMPGELAYGESREICGGLNSPLKFIVMPIAGDEKLVTLSNELEQLYMQLMQAYYGKSVNLSK